MNQNSTSVFNWIIDGGNIVSGQGSNTVNVQWGSVGTGLASVVETDMNGCKGDTISLVVTVGPSGLINLVKIGLEIYPNPTDNLLNIETIDISSYRLETSELNGKIIFGQEIALPNHQIDLSRFQKGVYFITIRSKDFVTTWKIIKL